MLDLRAGPRDACRLRSSREVQSYHFIDEAPPRSRRLRAKTPAQTFAGLLFLIDDEMLNRRPVAREWLKRSSFRSSGRDVRLA